MEQIQEQIVEPLRRVHRSVFNSAPSNKMYARQSLMCGTLAKNKKHTENNENPFAKKHFAKKMRTKKTREKTKEETLKKKKPCKTRKQTKTHCKTRKTLQTNTTTKPFEKKKNLAKKTETKLLEKSKPHAKKKMPRKKSKLNHLRTN